VLAAHGLDAADGQVLLLAQPRVLGHVFNPVSFWLCHDRAGALRVVIAEVNNTFGDRHSYMCHHDDLRPIARENTLQARKIFHVSPFPGGGGRLQLPFSTSTPEHVNIRIDYRAGEGRLLATLTGSRRPATTSGLMAAMLRRPFGSRRVLGLIHWQALKLWWKGARYHPRPAPPADEVTR
jgi:uncharacterized protein